MGLISILSRFTPSIGSLTLDAAITETHEMEAELTEFPVETGSDIADNRIKRPRIVTIDGVVASAPTNPLQIVGPLAPLSVPNGFKALEALFDSSELITVVTELKTYEDMAITKISIPRSNDTGRAIFFSMECRSVQIVSNRTFEVPVLEPEKASTQVEQGKKPTKPGPDLSQDDLSVFQQINRAAGIAQ
jgi:hypothetical protein